MSRPGTEAEAAPGAPPSPEAVGGADQRERLLDALSAVLAEEGIDAPMESMAARVGVSRMTLYRHFGGRQQLLMAILLHEGSRKARAMQEIMDGEGRSFQERVVEAMLFVVTMVRSSPVLRMFVEHLTPTEIGEMDAGGSFVGAIWGFVLPYFDTAEVRPLLRADPRSTVDWTLRQTLLILAAPGLNGGNEANLRTELETFFVPSIFR
ncbi:MAG TPA: TetR/AcrR family transcriptional regulator [Acidimicrobiales bacterium]|nr:TetR/AcrR family transcriptional regulator [Acidimicrobiales bacterium]